MSLSLFPHPFHLSTYIFINIYIWVSLHAYRVWRTLCKCYTLEWTVAERGCSWCGFTHSLPLLPVNAIVKRDGVRIFFPSTWGRKAFWNCLRVWQWKIWFRNYCFLKSARHMEGGIPEWRGSALNFMGAKLTVWVLADWRLQSAQLVWPLPRHDVTHTWLAKSLPVCVGQTECWLYCISVHVPRS